VFNDRELSIGWDGAIAIHGAREHNLEVIKSADWIIDLGPDAGDEGGQIVAIGTPEQVAACQGSHTGEALRTVLPLPAPSARPHRSSGKLREAALPAFPGQ